MTKRVYLEVARIIRRIIDINETKLIVLGGGGYEPMAAALCWAAVINELAELHLDLTIYDDECEKEPYEDNKVIEIIKQTVTKLTQTINLVESENL